MGFRSVAAFAQHERSAHRNRCANCGLVFPSARLLDFHISESHDPFFAIKAERGQPMVRGF